MTDVEWHMTNAVKWCYSKSIGNTKVSHSGDFTFVLVKGKPIFCKKTWHDYKTHTQQVTCFFVEPETKLETSRLLVLGKDEKSDVVSRETMNDLLRRYEWSRDFFYRTSFGFKVKTGNNKTRFFASRNGASKFAAKRGYRVEQV